MSQHERKQEERKGSRNGKRPSRSKLSFGDFDFIRLEMSAQDKEDFFDWLQDQQIGAGTVDYLLADGCKVSFSVDPNGGGVLCSASQQSSEHENAGGILTGRGGDAITALAVVIYKDSVMAHGKPWRQAAHERSQSQPEIG